MGNGGALHEYRENLVISFFAPGIPVPKGSTRSFVVNGRAVTTSTSGRALKDWHDMIAFKASEVAKELYAGPVWVEMEFVLPRPTSRPRKYRYPDRKPDLDKITRAGLDAMTGVIYKDDAQVVNLHVRKNYAGGSEQTGVYVSVWQEEEEKDGI